MAQRIGKKDCALLRLSAPLKKCYADIHGLDYGRLLDTTSYKEKYREKMIKWGEEQRKKDSDVFCRIVTSNEEAQQQPVWIVTDARRPSDIAYFRRKYDEKSILIRITSRDEVRVKRGWCFTPDVDDVDSECALDQGVKWDYIVENNEDFNANRPEVMIEKLCEEYIKNNSNKTQPER